MSEPSRSRIACGPLGPADPVDASDRQAARRVLRDRRATLAAARGEADDAAILEALDVLLASLPPGQAARRGEAGRPAPTLAAYWPMPGEPDVRSALERWHREGWDLALPQVRGRGTPLRFAAWAPGDPLAAGPLGTREPADALERIPDVLVIPCLGHDERGYRLGYGGGYYDRTLAALGDAGRRVVAIGVAREGAAVRGFEPGPHERPLDWIVTPSRRIPGQARG